MKICPPSSCSSSSSTSSSTSEYDLESYSYFDETHVMPQQCTKMAVYLQEKARENASFSPTSSHSLTSSMLSPHHKMSTHHHQSFTTKPDSRALILPIPNLLQQQPNMRRKQTPLIEELPTPPLTPTPSHFPSTTSPSPTHEIPLQEAKLGTTTARAILAQAYDTRTLAADTAASLHQQTIQLEAIAGGVNDTREILDGAEENIEKLTRPFWRRGRVAKGGGKGNGKSGNGGRFGIEGIGVKGKTPGKGFGWKTKDTGSKSGSNNHFGNAGVVILDDYSEYDEDVREELVTQDGVLAEVGVVVEELRGLAVGIGEELEKEAEIVDGIEVVEVTARIREGNRKLRQRLKLR